MTITERQLSSLLATNLIPGTLHALGAQTAGDVEDFFASRLCSQLVDAETGMWQLGCTTLARVFRDEGLSRIVLDNYYLYHIESPDHMIADLDHYRATGTLLDARW